jgi:hypothetical protein
MKTMTSRDIREYPARSRYELERPWSDKESWEPSPQQAKETERVIWVFIALLFTLIFVFGYLFWHKI